MGWTATEVLDALKTSLDARAEITALEPPNIVVWREWPIADYSITDAIILGYGGEFTLEPHAVGRLRFDEADTLDCQIRILRPAAASDGGAGTDAAAKDARDRAKAIFDQVEAEVRAGLPDPAGGDMIKSWVSGGTWAQFPDEAGEVPIRVFVLEFTIEWQART